MITVDNSLYGELSTNRLQKQTTASDTLVCRFAFGLICAGAQKPRKLGSKTKGHPQGVSFYFETDYGESKVKKVDNLFCRSDVHRVRVGRAERAQAIGDDTRMDGREPAEPRRGSWRGDAPASARKSKKTLFTSVFAFFGADYGARTRHLHLGKVALYQMS